MKNDKKATIDSETLTKILSDAFLQHKDRLVTEVIEEIAIKIDEHLFRTGKIDKRGEFNNSFKK